MSKPETQRLDVLGFDAHRTSPNEAERDELINHPYFQWYVDVTVGATDDSLVNAANYYDAHGALGYDDWRKQRGIR